MAFRKGVKPTLEHGIWSPPAYGPLSTKVDHALVLARTGLPRRASLPPVWIAQPLQGSLCLGHVLRRIDPR